MFLQKIDGIRNLKLMWGHLKIARRMSYRALSGLIAASLLVNLVGFGLGAPVLAQQEGEQTANLLPADTDLYFSINLDPAGGQLDKLRRVLNNWWQDPNVQAKWGELMGQVETGSSIDIKDDVLPWLGPEIAMGVRNPTAPEPEVIFITGTMEKSFSDAFLRDKLFPYIAEGTAVPPLEHYSGIEALYDFPEPGTYWAFSEEHVISSNSQSLLESCLELISAPAPAASLGGTADFKAAQAALPERVGLFYCNAGHIVEEIIARTSAPGQAILQAFSSYTPPYFAASLYFTDEGIGTSAYYPLPEGITLPTEPDLLQSAGIVPGDAWFFASGQDANANWQGLRSCLEGAWAETVSTITADLSGMTFEQAISYLDTQLGLNLDTLWADISPHLGGLSGMTWEEAISYLNTQLGLNLDGLWSKVTPHLGKLSGMAWEQAVSYLNTKLGMSMIAAFGFDLDMLWGVVGPYLGDLALMNLEEAISYLDTQLGLDLEALWADISPHLGELSGMTLEEAVSHLDTQLGLNLDELWAEISLCLEDLYGMTLEEAISYLDTQLSLDLEALWADISPHLGELSGMTLEEAIPYLDTQLSLDLDGLWTGLSPHLGELSGMTFEQAMAYLDEIPELGAARAKAVSVIEDLAQQSFESLIACFDGVLSEMTGEFSMALLPISPGQRVPDILWIFEVDDVPGVQQKIDNVLSAIEPWLLQVSALSIDGVTATMVTSSDIAASGASPGYLFLDRGTAHYLVIGSTEGALRAAVKASQAGIPSLNDAGEYQGVLALLPATKSDLAYFNITRLLDTIVSQISTQGMAEKGRAYFDLLLECIPLQSALAYSSASIDADAVTLAGAIYLLPPPLFEQLVTQPGMVAVSEIIRDLSSFDPDVGRVAVSLVVNILQAPGGASIQGILMKELPPEVESGFELAAAGAGVSIADIAYGISVDKTNLTADNIGAATITMKVGRSWADAYGVENVKVFRISDGTRQALPTAFTGYEGDYAVFVGVSEGGLSTFGLVAVSPLATAFAVSDLSISPGEAKTGESVTITAKVTNGSIAGGDYTASLKLDGVAVDTRQVTLPGGASQTVSFTVVRDTAGTYGVEVGGLNGSFSVSAQGLPPEKVPPGINWALIGGIMGGVMVLAAVAAILLRRRPGAYPRI